MSHEWNCPGCGYRNGVCMSASPRSCAMCRRSRYTPIQPDAPGYSGTATILVNIPKVPS